MTLPNATAVLPETASQTAGPYVHIGLAPRAAGFQVFEREPGPVMAGPQTAGQRIAVQGLVFDGSGSAVRDVLIECWQADAHGRYGGGGRSGAAHAADRQTGRPDADPHFSGWGRACSDFDTGLWRFDTVKPGRVTGRHGVPMAPHLNLWIVARGINLGLHTRVYFDDEAAANASDPVLNAIEWDVRRSTLVARRDAAVDAAGMPVYRFDIRLQGAGETVFFDI